MIPAFYAPTLSSPPQFLKLVSLENLDDVVMLQTISKQLGLVESQHQIHAVHITTQTFDMKFTLLQNLVASPIDALQIGCRIQSNAQLRWAIISAAGFCAVPLQPVVFDKIRQKPPLNCNTQRDIVTAIVQKALASPQTHLMSIVAQKIKIQTSCIREYDQLLASTFFKLYLATQNAVAKAGSYPDLVKQLCTSGSNLFVRFTNLTAMFDHLAVNQDQKNESIRFLLQETGLIAQCDIQEFRAREACPSLFLVGDTLGNFCVITAVQQSREKCQDEIQACRDEDYFYPGLLVQKSFGVDSIVQKQYKLVDVLSIEDVVYKIQELKNEKCIMEDEEPLLLFFEQAMHWALSTQYNQDPIQQMIQKQSQQQFRAHIISIFRLASLNQAGFSDSAAETAFRGNKFINAKISDQILMCQEKPTLRFQLDKLLALDIGYAHYIITTLQKLKVYISKRDTAGIRFGALFLDLLDISKIDETIIEELCILALAALGQDWLVESFGINNKDLQSIHIQVKNGDFDSELMIAISKFVNTCQNILKTKRFQYEMKMNNCDQFLLKQTPPSRFFGRIDKKSEAVSVNDMLREEERPEQVIQLESALYGALEAAQIIPSDDTMSNLGEDKCLVQGAILAVNFDETGLRFENVVGSTLPLTCAACYKRQVATKEFDDSIALKIQQPAALTDFLQEIQSQPVNFCTDQTRLAIDGHLLVTDEERQLANRLLEAEPVLSAKLHELEVQPLTINLLFVADLCGCQRLLYRSIIVMSGRHQPQFSARQWEPNQLDTLFQQVVEAACQRISDAHSAKPGSLLGYASRIEPLIVVHGCPTPLKQYQLFTSLKRYYQNQKFTGERLHVVQTSGCGLFVMENGSFPSLQLEPKTFTCRSGKLVLKNDSAQTDFMAAFRVQQLTMSLTTMSENACFAEPHTGKEAFINMCMDFGNIDIVRTRSLLQMFRTGSFPLVKETRFTQAGKERIVMNYGYSQLYEQQLAECVSQYYQQEDCQLSQIGQLGTDCTFKEFKFAQRPMYTKRTRIHSANPPTAEWDSTLLTNYINSVTNQKICVSLFLKFNDYSSELPGRLVIYQVTRLNIGDVSPGILPALAQYHEELQAVMAQLMNDLTEKADYELQERKALFTFQVNKQQQNRQKAPNPKLLRIREVERHLEDVRARLRKELQDTLDQIRASRVKKEPENIEKIEPFEIEAALLVQGPALQHKVEKQVETIRSATQNQMQTPKITINPKLLMKKHAERIADFVEEDYDPIIARWFAKELAADLGRKPPVPARIKKEKK